MRLFKFLVGTFVEVVCTLIIGVLTLLVAISLLGLIYSLVS